MQKLLALVLVLFGISTGVAAGLYFQPIAPSPLDSPEDAEINDRYDTAKDADFLRLNNQFLVPLIDDKTVKSMVALSIELEIEPGSKDGLYVKEPKLRDSFLQIMFDHANAGGFTGRFTDSTNMDVLRRSLLDSAKLITQNQVISVLITDIARQDF